MSDSLKISVVVATYNRRDTIAVTIDCFNSQTLDPRYFEVIVVDDGSPDDTEDVVHCLIEKVRFPLRYLKHSNRGPGFTQNQGIRAAKASLILLIADDIHLVPGALEAHLKAHEQHPEKNVAILGRVEQSKMISQSAFLSRWDPFKFRELEGYEELPYYLFWACNISCKRDFLLEHGLFREQRGRAGAAAHEDAELGYRLFKRAGLRIFYYKEALGYHYHVETLEGAMRRAYERGLNWKDFRALVDSPDITVRYHILSIHTLKDHLDAFHGSNNLMGADRNPLYLIIRQFLRVVLFNNITVYCFWLPLMRIAEKKTMAAHLMHRNLYRGVIAYHFFKGVAHGRKIVPIARHEGNEGDIAAS